jgi:uncharacterized protein (TIGR02271 family)
MTNPSTNTTLVSLFHTHEHASRALADLQAAGVPQQSIQTLGSENGGASLTSLQSLHLPESDLKLLSDGLRSGGTVIVVRAEGVSADHAEDVFERHHASKVDERVLDAQPTAAAVQSRGAQTVAAGETIPVIEEELVVGKRAVERGGVRVFSRIRETPVEESVRLREEHASIERHAVNRPISEADLDRLQDQTIEVREVGEEAVVAKTARVVEEVSVGKTATETTQQVRDTVRKTQIEVEPVASSVPSGDRGTR